MARGDPFYGGRPREDKDSFGDVFKQALGQTLGQTLGSLPAVPLQVGMQPGGWLWRTLSPESEETHLDTSRAADLAATRAGTEQARAGADYNRALAERSRVLAKLEPDQFKRQKLATLADAFYKMGLLSMQHEGLDLEWQKFQRLKDKDKEDLKRAHSGGGKKRVGYGYLKNLYEDLSTRLDRHNASLQTTGQITTPPRHSVVEEAFQVIADSGGQVPPSDATYAVSVSPQQVQRAESINSELVLARQLAQEALQDPNISPADSAAARMILSISQAQGAAYSEVIGEDTDELKRRRDLESERRLIELQQKLENSPDKMKTEDRQELAKLQREEREREFKGEMQSERQYHDFVQAQFRGVDDELQDVNEQLDLLQKSPATRFVNGQLVTDDAELMRIIEELQRTREALDIRRRELLNDLGESVTNSPGGTR